MRGALIFLTVCLLISTIVSAWIWHYLGWAPIPHEPPLSAAVQRESIPIGPLSRSYVLYAPRGLPAKAPLVIVLHAGRQTPEEMRVSSGYRFDRLADEHGFAVVYPDAWGGHWNDCRTEASSQAREQGIDDTGFLLALIDHLHHECAIDPGRVFVTGYANGGQMAFRLALEAPERFAAIAAIAANLPSRNRSLCPQTGSPIAALLMNGTADPINPYNGGIVALARMGDRGTVLSAADSAEWFARVDGQAAPPAVTRLPHREPEDPTRVERTDWTTPGKPEVVLDTVYGGGHVVPQSVYSAPRILGPTTRDLDGPAEIWAFFERQPPRKLLQSAESQSLVPRLAHYPGDSP
jgi:polyhydroxybutyrate depolymerase